MVLVELGDLDEAELDAVLGLQTFLHQARAQDIILFCAHASAAF